MFRYIALFMVLFAFPALADYEINLSVLDSLDYDSSQDELPLPIVKNSPRSKKNQTAKAKAPAPIIENKVKAPAKTEVALKDEASAKKEDIVEKTQEVAEEKVNVVPESSAEDDKNMTAENVTVDFDAPEGKTAPEQPKEDSQEEIIIQLPIKNLNEVDSKPQEDITDDNEVRPDEIALIPLDNNDPSHDSETSTLITFDDQSDRLTDDVVALLDEFVEKNKDFFNSKVLIESYHFTGGDGAFARKRTSLNRAVNVRSYLLSKGFKSFAIQIINTEEEVMQNNVTISR